MNRGKHRPYRFETRQWVPFPAEQVFAFFADPHNLPRLMPPALKTRIEKLSLMPPQREATAQKRPSGGKTAGMGPDILISFRPIPWLPLRIRWLARGASTSSAQIPG